MNSIKILGKEYRIRTDADPEHIEQVARYVDELLREVQRTTPDTQDSAILVALNLASDLIRLRAGGAGVPVARIRALIELVESA